MILFGGEDSQGADLNDVWSLSLGAPPQWSQLTPLGSRPAGRVGSSTAYDSANARLIMFGGGLGHTSPCVNDVWVLSNANGVGGLPTWTQLTPSGTAPAPRWAATAIYAPASNTMTIFGGNNCFSTTFNEVWVLSNANGLGGTPFWTQLSPAGTAPSASDATSAVYDPGSNRMILYGFPANPDQVWVLTNANGLGGTPTWIQLSSSVAGPPKTNQATAYDASSNTLIVFGGLAGNVFTNDTWVLSNANGLGGAPNWTQLNPSGGPPSARCCMATVYDPATKRMVVFGGGNNTSSLNDTWTLSFAPPTPVQILSISPAIGGNAGNVTARIFGNGFQSGATVRLTGVGPDIVGSNTAVTNVINTSVLGTVFDLTGASPGVRDVVVTNPDGTTATLAGGFTVQQGGAPQVSVDIVGLEKIRIGQAQSYYLVVKNAGTVDAVGVPVWVEVPSNVELAIGFDLTPDPVLSSSPGAAASLDTGSTPYQVTVGNSTIAGFYKPYVPAGSATVLPITLAVNSAIAPFDLHSWVFPSNLANATGTFVATNPTDALECTIDLSSLVLDGAGVPVPPVISAFLDNLVDFSKGRPDLAQTQISMWKIFTDLAQHDGVVLSPSEADALSAFDTFLNSAGKGIGVASAIKHCAPLLPIIVGVLTGSPVASLDPNDKVGARGVGARGYLSGSTPQPYSVFFANETAATAPAQRVVVTDSLNPLTEDLTTFSLGPIALLSSQIISPPPGPRDFQTTVDLRPTNNTLVAINAHLDALTGSLTWTFQSLDPATNQPPTDPTEGFLPPGAGGSVFFTVKPKQGLPTDTQIQNQATVVFDSNPPINTPTWTNTIDNTPPTSQVKTLPATEFSATFPVTWAGTDIGAGVQDFTIYVSDNGGPFTAFQTNTTATSATFIGQNGHTYAFYSIARDLVGNVEAAKTAAEATTLVSVDTIPPTTTVVVSPLSNAAGWNNSNVTVTITSVDNPGGSGVQQITYSGSGAQTIASTVVPGASTSFTVSSEGITTITFFGTDNAGNVESAKTLTIQLDKTPPTIACSVSPNVLWPPDNKLVPLNLSVNVTDALSGSAGFTLVSVTSNEPDSGQGDIQGFVTGTASTTGQLRAQRLGSGSGRVYMFTYNGSDKAGNTASCTTTATVPHDQSNN